MIKELSMCSNYERRLFIKDIIKTSTALTVTLYTPMLLTGCNNDTPNNTYTLPAVQEQQKNEPIPPELIQVEGGSLLVLAGALFLIPELPEILLIAKVISLIGSIVSLDGSIVSAKKYLLGETLKKLPVDRLKTVLKIDNHHINDTKSISKETLDKWADRIKADIDGVKDAFTNAEKNNIKIAELLNASGVTQFGSPITKVGKRQLIIQVPENIEGKSLLLGSTPDGGHKAVYLVSNFIIEWLLNTDTCSRVVSDNTYYGPCGIDGCQVIVVRQEFGDKEAIIWRDTGDESSAEQLEAHKKHTRPYSRCASTEPCSQEAIHVPEGIQFTNSD